MNGQAFFDSMLMLRVQLYGATLFCIHGSTRLPETEYSWHHGYKTVRPELVEG
jgi:hypothetical protein